MSQTQLSGLSDRPQYLVAPRSLDFGDGSIIKNVYCYVLRHHGQPGIGVLYYRQNDEICIQIGDWNGNVLDLSDPAEPLAGVAHEYLNKFNVPMYNLLHNMGVPQCQLFLNDQLTLCDLQTSINKFAGPGMVQNIFSGVIKTPEVLVIEVLDQRAVDAIDAGTGSYAGDLILKPSRFRHYQMDDGKYTPLHVQVVR